MGLISEGGAASQAEAAVFHKGAPHIQFALPIGCDEWNQKLKTLYPGIDAGFG